VKKIIFLFICTLITGCGSEIAEAPMPSGDPSAPKNKDLRGYEYHPYTMKRGDGDLFWAQQALSGYRGANEKDKPSQIVTLEESCSFPEPKEGDEFYHIYIADSMQDVPVFTMSVGDISERAEHFVNAYAVNEGKVRGFFTGDDEMGIANVVITKTDQPIYLVLTSQTKVIWNIHSGADVKIAHIALIGRDSVGIANQPAGTTITAAGIYKRDQCGAAPARKPRDHWRFVQNVKNHGTGRDLLLKNKKAASAYRSWFKKTFGRSSAENYTQAYGLSNILIGDLPQEETDRIAYSSIKDSTIFVTQDDYQFTASRRDYKARNLALVRATAEQAAGGDLSSLLQGVQ